MYNLLADMFDFIVNESDKIVPRTTPSTEGNIAYSIIVVDLFLQRTFLSFYSPTNMSKYSTGANEVLQHSYDNDEESSGDESGPAQKRIRSQELSCAMTQMIASSTGPSK